LTAIGFGTLTPLPDQIVQGHGLWNDGRWHVILRRALEVPGQNNVAFAANSTIPFALAVWDGSQGDRDGQKLISTWYQLRLGSKPGGAPAERAAASSTADHERKIP
jgi:complex iron-sulfur molybdoenzyme family reductase subunit gamma